MHDKIADIYAYGGIGREETAKYLNGFDTWITTVSRTYKSNR